MSFFRGACFEVRGEMCVLGSSGAGSRSDAEFFRGVYAHLCKSGLSGWAEWFKGPSGEKCVRIRSWVVFQSQSAIHVSMMVWR